MAKKGKLGKPRVRKRGKKKAAEETTAPPLGLWGIQAVHNKQKPVQGRGEEMGGGL